MRLLPAWRLTSIAACSIVISIAASALMLPAAAFAQSLGTCTQVVCDPKPVGDSPLQQLVVNGRFEDPNATLPSTNGNIVPTWTRSGLANFSSVSAHCGALSMSLPGAFFGFSSSASQPITIPTTITHAYLDFWVFFPSFESDFLTVRLGGTTVSNLVSSSTTSGKWSHIGLIDIDVSALRGQSPLLTFSGNTTTGRGPSIDDVSLTTALHLLWNFC